MNYSVVINEDIQRDLSRHLIRSDYQEDLCFGTYQTSTGSKRITAIIQALITPKIGERKIHGNVGFLSNYFQRALDFAIKRNEGLVFFHSHPWPGWQEMSNDDILVETQIAPSIKGATSLPLVGMTMGTDQSWSARFWIKDSTSKRKYIRNWCEDVRIVGNSLKVTFNDNLVNFSINPERQLRTISAWGEKTQKDLSRLKIGIVGLGSVGSFISESLARLGVTKIILIDFDIVEEKNLDRLTNVFSNSIGLFKVEAVKKGILKSNTSTKIDVYPIPYSICEEIGYNNALDCDLLFSCVDRPWPRQVLNFIAYAHLIPVIDGGIKVRTNKKNSKMLGSDWKVQTVGYGKPCLECLGQYSSENAKLERDGLLDNPSYIDGLENKKQFLEASENVFPFSTHLGSMEVLQMLSMFISPLNISNVGQQMYHFTSGKLDQYFHKNCNKNCFFQSILGNGDSTKLQVWDADKYTEKVRNYYSFKS